MSMGMSDGWGEAARSSTKDQPVLYEHTSMAPVELPGEIPETTDL